MSEQFYGIKYPFIKESDRNTFLDLNENHDDGVRSMLLHIIFTPKGQRLRKPDFGTDLIKYIFEPSDSDTWDKIKSEIRQQISKYLPQVKFNNIKIINNSNETDLRGIFVEIDYSIEKNGQITNNKTMVKI